MKKSYINFSIKKKRVYKMEYNGCTGQDTIDIVKSMVAFQNSVEEKDINVSFSDEIIKKKRIVSSDVVAEMDAIIRFRMNLN